MKTGLKFGFWKKVGSAALQENIDVLFGDTDDYGVPEIEVSRRWYVWRINELFRNTGVLGPECQEAGIGVVFVPSDITERMNAGSYGIVHRGY